MDLVGVKSAGMSTSLMSCAAWAMLGFVLATVYKGQEPVEVEEIQGCLQAGGTNVLF